ncbi:MAG: Cache 3/Cache 2 fusion domain-containing protein, partial [Ktedonobacterales bacterium]
DTTLVDRTKAAIGANATIYQLEGPDLVAISTTLPVVNGGHTVAGARALGDKLSGSPFRALVGDCGAAENASCHHPYQGLATLHGVSYVTAFTPLYDMNGNFVGALGTASPYAAVIAPCVALAVILLFIGLLMALVGVAMGLWAYGSSAGKMLDSLDARLTRVADSAADREYLTRGQVERVERQRRMARQVGEEARRLDTLAGALVQSQSALRDAAGAIWAEMSQPGAQPDGEAALRLARQTAVVSGQMGIDAGDARLHCRQLVTLMNHVTAEGDALGATGARMREHALALRGAVEQVELTVGERLLPRAPGDDARKPFFRWGRNHPNRPAPAPTAQPARPTTQQFSAVGDASSSRPRYNTLRNAQTGAHRAISNPTTGTTGSLSRQRPITRPTPDGSQSTGRHRVPERPEPAASGPRTGQQRGLRPGNLGLPSLPEERRDSWRDISTDFEEWD